MDICEETCLILCHIHFQIVAPKNANPDSLPSFWREILRLPLPSYRNQENQATGFEPPPPAQTIPMTIQPTITSMVVTCSNSSTFPSFTITPQIEGQNIEIQGMVVKGIEF